MRIDQTIVLRKPRKRWSEAPAFQSVDAGHRSREVICK